MAARFGRPNAFQVPEMLLDCLRRYGGGAGGAVGIGAITGTPYRFRRSGAVPTAGSHYQLKGLYPLPSWQGRRPGKAGTRAEIRCRALLPFCSWFFVRGKSSVDIVRWRFTTTDYLQRTTDKRQPPEQRPRPSRQRLAFPAPGRRGQPVATLAALGPILLDRPDLLHARLTVAQVKPASSPSALSVPAAGLRTVPAGTGPPASLSSSQRAAACRASGRRPGFFAADRPPSADSASSAPVVTSPASHATLPSATRGRESGTLRNPVRPTPCCLSSFATK